MNDVLLESALRIVRDAAVEHQDDDCFTLQLEADDWQLMARVARAFRGVGIETELTDERGELLARRCKLGRTIIAA